MELTDQKRLPAWLKESAEESAISAWNTFVRFLENTTHGSDATDGTDGTDGWKEALMDIDDEVESVETVKNDIERIWDELKIDIWRLPDDLMEKEGEFESFLSERLADCQTYREVITQLRPEIDDEYPERLLSHKAVLPSPLTTSLKLDELSEDGLPELRADLQRISLAFQSHGDVFQVRMFWQNGEDGIFQFPSSSLPIISYNGKYWRLVNPSKPAIDLMRSSSDEQRDWYPPDDGKLLEVVRYYPHKTILKHPWLLKNVLRLFSRNDETGRSFGELLDEFSSLLSTYAPDLATELRDVDGKHSIHDQEGLNFDCAGNTLCRSFQLEKRNEGEQEAIIDDDDYDDYEDDGEGYDDDDDEGDEGDDYATEAGLIDSYPRDVYIHLGRSGIKLLHPIKADGQFGRLSYDESDDWVDGKEVGQIEWFLSYPDFIASETAHRASELVDHTLGLTATIQEALVHELMNMVDEDYHGEVVELSVNAAQFLQILETWVPELVKEHKGSIEKLILKFEKAKR